MASDHICIRSLTFPSVLVCGSLLGMGHGAIAMAGFTAVSVFYPDGIRFGGWASDFRGPLGMLMLAPAYVAGCAMIGAAFGLLGYPGGRLWMRLKGFDLIGTHIVVDEKGYLYWDTISSKSIAVILFIFGFFAGLMLLLLGMINLWVIPDAIRMDYLGMNRLEAKAFLAASASMLFVGPLMCWALHLGSGIVYLINKHVFKVRLRGVFELKIRREDG